MDSLAPSLLPRGPFPHFTGELVFSWYAMMAFSPSQPAFIFSNSWISTSAVDSNLIRRFHFPTGISPMEIRSPAVAKFCSNEPPPPAQPAKSLCEITTGKRGSSFGKLCSGSVRTSPVKPSLAGRRKRRKRHERRNKLHDRPVALFRRAWRSYNLVIWLRRDPTLQGQGAIFSKAKFWAGYFTKPEPEP